MQTAHRGGADHEEDPPKPQPFEGEHALAATSRVALLQNNHSGKALPPSPILVS